MRRVKKRVDGDEYNYYQVVEAKRVNGQPRQVVHVHLGDHATVEEALASWPSEVERLRLIGRHRQADKLADKLGKLRDLEEQVS